jgi:hypothetical protein
VPPNVDPPGEAETDESAGVGTPHDEGVEEPCGVNVGSDGVPVIAGLAQPPWSTFHESVLGVGWSSMPLAPGSHTFPSSCEQKQYS